MYIFIVFSPTLSFIIIVLILVMQNQFLCNCIHTWRKKNNRQYIFTFVFYRACIVMYFIFLLSYFYFLHFYHLIQYSSNQVIDHPALYFGVDFLLIQLLIFSCYPISLLVTTRILFFQGVSLLKQGYSLLITRTVFSFAIVFFSLWSSIPSVKLLLPLFLVTSVIYYFQAIQLLRVSNHYISSLVHGWVMDDDDGWGLYVMYVIRRLTFIFYFY